MITHQSLELAQVSNSGSICRSRKSDTGFTVFIVDNDPADLTELAWFVVEAGYKCRTFSFAREFLADHDPLVQGCAVVNVVMPDLDGFQIQHALSLRCAHRPIIFITGRGDVPTSVRAMKAGAIDFLTKPIDDDDLLAAIEQARKAESKAINARTEIALIEARLATLTPRERQVLPYVVAGMLNKQIAVELGIVEKTIKVHRGRMMNKMGVRTVQDLVRLAERANIELPEGSGITNFNFDS